MAYVIAASKYPFSKVYIQTFLKQNLDTMSKKLLELSQLIFKDHKYQLGTKTSNLEIET